MTRSKMDNQSNNGAKTSKVQGKKSLALATAESRSEHNISYVCTRNDNNGTQSPLPVAPGNEKGELNKGADGPTWREARRNREKYCLEQQSLDGSAETDSEGEESSTRPGAVRISLNSEYGDDDEEENQVSTGDDDDEDEAFDPRVEPGIIVDPQGEPGLIVAKLAPEDRDIEAITAEKERLKQQLEEQQNEKDMLAEAEVVKTMKICGFPRYVVITGAVIFLVVVAAVITSVLVAKNKKIPTQTDSPTISLAPTGSPTSIPTETPLLSRPAFVECIAISEGVGSFDNGELYGFLFHVHVLLKTNTTYEAIHDVLLETLQMQSAPRLAGCRSLTNRIRRTEEEFQQISVKNVVFDRLIERTNGCLGVDQLCISINVLTRLWAESKSPITTVTIQEPAFNALKVLDLEFAQEVRLVNVIRYSASPPTISLSPTNGGASLQVPTSSLTGNPTSLDREPSIASTGAPNDSMKSPASSSTFIPVPSDQIQPTNPTPPGASPPTSPFPTVLGNLDTSLSPMSQPQQPAPFNELTGTTANPSTTSSTSPSQKTLSSTPSSQSRMPSSSPMESSIAIPSIDFSLEPTGTPSTQKLSSPSTTTPSAQLTVSPIRNPTAFPSNELTVSPTKNPTAFPLNELTASPTKNPTTFPSNELTVSPTNNPTTFPSNGPSNLPTKSPTGRPTPAPSVAPTTGSPTPNPTDLPTQFPTTEPTCDPASYANDFFEEEDYQEISIFGGGVQESCAKARAYEMDFFVIHVDGCATRCLGRIDFEDITNDDVCGTGTNGGLATGIEEFTVYIVGGATSGIFFSGFAESSSLECEDDLVLELPQPTDAPVFNVVAPTTPAPNFGLAPTPSQRPPSPGGFISP